MQGSPAVHSLSFAAGAGLAALTALVAPGAAQECRIPTAGTPLTVTQPDGRTIEVFFRGTGFNHWYEDARGFAVIETPGGWMYARGSATGELVPTGGAVGSSDPAGLGLSPGLRPSQPRLGGAGSPNPTGSLALSTGTVENLVLLVRFSDHGPGGQDRTLPSVADVATIMNAVGGDATLAPTGSVRDYYLEASYGALTIDSTVVGWIDVPQTETLVADGVSGFSSYMPALIVDVLELADLLVDFSAFDDDGDGAIDMITFLHSGYGAEWGGYDVYGTGIDDRIWSHKGSIPTWTSDEGVRVSDYHISPGLWELSGSDPGRIGVVCHELGHFLGLPDLYDNDGSSCGVGQWCLMGAGSWGFDWGQLYPTHPSAWCKVKLGWVSPTTIQPGTYVAQQAETTPQVYEIDSGFPPGEYLLIENRQPVGFDALIPQGGLAVWHVDENIGLLGNFLVNADEGYPGQPGWPENGEHYRVGLLQADGDYALETFGDFGNDTDLFHSGLTPIIDWLTTPNTSAYQDGDIVVNENRIEGIGTAGASMDFTYVNATTPVVFGLGPAYAFQGAPFATSFPAFGTPPLTWTEYVPAPTYALADLGPQPFDLGGTPLGFTGTTDFGLPFAFPFYETSYTSVRLTAQGTIALAPILDEDQNRTASLRALPLVAGLWDDLNTLEIWVTASATSARFRWQALEGGQPVNFAITLYDDGRIRFDYGAGNTGLTPTVGISRGEGGELLLAPSHDGESTLTNASSLLFTRSGSGIPPGLKLSTSGSLSGTPSVTGTFMYWVRVTDGSHRYVQQLFETPVRPLLPPAHPAPALPFGPPSASAGPVTIRLP